MKTDLILKLSKMIDKMGIAKELEELEVNKDNDKASKETLGKKIIVMLITKLYTVEDEVYDVICSYKGITKEEAKELDIIATIKEIANAPGVADFFQ